MESDSRVGARRDGPAVLRVRLFGGLEVEGIEPARLGTAKARTLLKALALARGAPVGVDRLAACVWGEGQPSRPAEQLAVLVSRLRSVLGADRLRRGDAGYSLVTDWLDVAVFDELADEARRRAADEPATARMPATAALALVRGDLLGDLLGEDTDAVWAEADRVAIARRVADVRRLAAQAALAAGDPEAAAEAAATALGHDPYDEAALRLLLVAESRAGRPAVAVAAFERTRALLRDELGLDPSPATVETYTTVLRGEGAATPVVVAPGPDVVAVRRPDPGPTADTIRAAAVLGLDVDIDLLAAVLATPPVGILRDLEDGVRTGLLVERGAAPRFASEDLREQVATGTGSARRALLHREAARSLATRPDADPLRVAHHARLGGDTALAAKALTEAADAATRRHDRPEALRLLDAAVDLADSGEIRMARAEVNLAEGRLGQATADADAALRLGCGARALRVAGWAAYYGRDFTAARHLADAGSTLADDPQVRASCLTLAGRVRHAAGDISEASKRLEEALATGRGPEAVVTSVWLGGLRLYQGRPDEALDLLAAGTVVAEGQPHPFAHVHALMGTGAALATLGRPLEALAAFDLLDQAIARGSLARYAGRSDNFRGWILRNLGAAAEADDHNTAGLELASAAPSPTAEPVAHSLLDLADGRLRAGELDAAAALLDRVGAVPGARDEVFAWRQDLRCRLLRGRLALAAGDTDDAAGIAVTVAEDAAGLSSARHATAARLLLALARARGGERVDPASVAADVDALDRFAGLEAWWMTADIAAGLGVDAWWATARRRVARLAAQAGDRAEAFRRAADARLAARPPA